MHSTRRRAAFGRNRLAWPGLAVTAFVAGSILGPAAVTADPKAEDVFVVNGAASPVPISGTVNVGNLPATQTVSGTVDVGNLPAIQEVSGTVDIGTAPAPVNVSGGTFQSSTTPPSSTNSVQIVDPIDVTAVMFHSDQTAHLTIGTSAVGNGYRVVSAGGATVTQSFGNPLPDVSTFVVSCVAATTCRWEFSVAGIE